MSDRENMTTTTAIVPTYNRARFIEPCLNAILAQCRPASQILVIDDGSADDTAQVVTGFGSRVTLVTTENRGKSAALNLALSHAKGDYIWIIDDDDLVRPEALSALAGTLDRDAKVDMAYGRHDRFRIDEKTGTKTSLGSGYWTRCPSERFLTSTMEDFFAHQPGMLVRKSLYDAVGGFDETLTRSVDYEMLIRLARAGRAEEVPQIVFDQRIHDGDRGPFACRIDARQRDENWVENDKRIFERVYRQYPLDAYLPTGESASAPLSKRQALLQRATIMARKKLWTKATADWAMAAQFPGALTDEEIAIIRRATGSKYGCTELTDQHWLIGFLRDLGASSQTGLEISRAFARGLLWPVRNAAENGDFNLALARAVFWFQTPKFQRPGRNRQAQTRMASEGEGSGNSFKALLPKR